MSMNNLLPGESISLRQARRTTCPRQVQLHPAEDNPYMNAWHQALGKARQWFVPTGERTDETLRGLTNLGQTCWFNAPLQVLMHNKAQMLHAVREAQLASTPSRTGNGLQAPEAMKEAQLANTPSEIEQALHALTLTYWAKENATGSQTDQRLFKVTQGNQGAKINPRKLWNAVKKTYRTKDKEYKTDTQEDAGLLMLHLLQGTRGQVHTTHHCRRPCSSDIAHARRYRALTWSELPGTVHWRATPQDTLLPGP